MKLIKYILYLPCIAVLMTIADGVHVFVDPIHLIEWGSCAWESSHTLTLQNRGLLLAGIILILGIQMLYLVYISIRRSHVPTAAKLLSTASYLALQLSLKRKIYNAK